MRKFIKYYLDLFMNFLFLPLSITIIVILSYLLWDKVNVILIILINLGIFFFILQYVSLYYRVTRFLIHYPFIKKKWVNIWKLIFTFNIEKPKTNVHFLDYYFRCYDDLIRIETNKLKKISKSFTGLKFLKIKLNFILIKGLGKSIDLMTQSQFIFWLITLFVIILFPMQFVRHILGTLLIKIFYLKGKLRGFRDIFFYKYFGWDSRVFFAKVLYYYYSYVGWILRELLSKPFLKILNFPTFIISLYTSKNIRSILNVRLFILMTILILFLVGIYPLIQYLNEAEGLQIFNIFKVVGSYLGIDWKFVLILVIVYIYFILIFPLILWTRFLVSYFFEEEKVRKSIDIQDHFYKDSKSAYLDLLKYQVDLTGWSLCLNIQGKIFLRVFEKWCSIISAVDPKAIFAKNLLKSNIFFWWKWFGFLNYFGNLNQKSYYYMFDKIYERGYIGANWYNYGIPYLKYCMFLLLDKKEIKKYHPDKETIKKISTNLKRLKKVWGLNEEQKTIVWKYLKRLVWLNLEIRRMYNIDWPNLNIKDPIELIGKLFRYDVIPYSECLIQTNTTIHQSDYYKDKLCFYEILELPVEHFLFFTSKINYLNRYDFDLNFYFDQDVVLKNKKFSKFKFLQGLELNNLAKKYYNNVDNHILLKNIFIPKSFKACKKSKQMEEFVVKLNFESFFYLEELKLHLNKNECTIVGLRSQLVDLKIYNYNMCLYYEFYKYGYSKLLEKIIPWCEEYKELSELTPEYELVIEKFKDKLENIK